MQQYIGEDGNLQLQLDVPKALRPPVSIDPNALLPFSKSFIMQHCEPQPPCPLQSPSCANAHANVNPNANPNGNAPGGAYGNGQRSSRGSTMPDQWPLPGMNATYNQTQQRGSSVPNYGKLPNSDQNYWNMVS